MSSSILQGLLALCLLLSLLQVHAQHTGFRGVFGVDELDGQNGASLYGDFSYERAGEIIASVGDVNQDGYDDILVGAYKYSDLESSPDEDRGRAFLVLGTSTEVNGEELAGVSVVITGLEHSQIGHGASSAGDFNGDGIPDFMLGTGDQHGGNGPDLTPMTDCGEVFLFWGKAGSDFSHIQDPRVLYDPVLNAAATYGVVFHGSAASDFAGFHIASMGDLSGDLIDDIAIAAISAATPGFVFIVYGAENWNTSVVDLSTADVSFMLPISTGTETMWSVEGGGDLNGDEINDIVVAIVGDSSNAGAVYIIWGRSDLAGVYDMASMGQGDVTKIVGANADLDCGRSVAIIPDMTEDGYDELLVGCQGELPARARLGDVYLLYGARITDWTGATFSEYSASENATHFVGLDSSDQFGRYVGNVGDINNDGFPDIGIGSMFGHGFCDLGADGVGDATVLYGNGERIVPFDGNTDWHDGDWDIKFGINGPIALGSAPRFGRITSAGDFNGDGTTDIMVAGYFSTTSVSRGGSVHIMFGPFGFDLMCPSLSDDGTTVCNGVSADYCDPPPACLMECIGGYTGASEELTCLNDGLWDAPAISCLFMDGCDSSPCMNGGSCISDGADFSCDCPLGWTGFDCSISYYTCDSSPCENGDCISDLDSFECSCDSEFTGDLCQTEISACDSTPCLNDGLCLEEEGEVTCDCWDTGFEGSFCQTNIDDCASDPCANFGICTDGTSSFTCDCLGTGYTGLTCEEVDFLDDCSSSPCLNGGACQDLGVFSYGCECVDPAFTGSRCEIEIAACDSAPCANGATCEAGDNPATEFLCHCADGYTGVLCETDVDYCESTPCFNGATCESDTEEATYVCHCDTGYTGEVCTENIDDCEGTPCENGGVCEDLVDDFSCDCSDTGFEGVICADAIDECLSAPCENGGTCTDGSASYTCDCTGTGYEGPQCTSIVNTNINCDDPEGTCYNGGTCYDSTEGFYCGCMAGYDGIQCENDVDECASSPCREYDCVTEAVNMYTCLVPPVVNLVAPNEVGVCALLVLDATSSTGLTDPVKVIWTATVVEFPDGFIQADLDRVNSALAGFENQTYVALNVTETLVANTTFSFGVEITNGYGLSDEGTQHVAVTTYPLPLVTLSAPVDVLRAEALTVASVITYDACFPKGAAVTYVWSIDDTEITLDETTKTSPSLFVASHSLAINTVYTFTLHVTFAGEEELYQSSTFSTIQVTALQSDVVAVIDGGDRLVSTQSDTIVVATNSYDPDLNPASNEGLSFQWSCVFAGSSLDCGFTSIDYNYGSDTTAELFIPIGLLDGEISYTFTVVVTRDSDGTFATQQVVIDTSADPVIDVGITLLEPGSTGNSPQYLWLYGKLSLEGSAIYDDGSEGAFVYEWSVASSDEYVNISLASTTLDTPYLTFDCGSLPLGAVTFQLTVTDTSNGDVSGYASKDFIVINDEPATDAAEPLVVSATSGTAFATDFLLTAVGFTSAAPASASQSLFYQFKYYNASEVDPHEILLSQLTSSASLDTILPAGDIKLVVYVTDTLGVSTRYERTDTITVDKAVYDVDTVACFAYNRTNDILADAIAGQENGRSMHIIRELADAIHMEGVNVADVQMCNGLELNVVDDLVSEWNAAVEVMLSTMALAPSDSELVAQTLVSLVTLNPTLDIVVSLDAIFEGLYSGITSCLDNVQDVIVRVLESIMLSGSCDAQMLVNVYLNQLMQYDLATAIPGESPTNYVSEVFTALTASLYPGEESTIAFGDKVSITFPATGDDVVELNVIEFASTSLCFGNTSAIGSPIIDITFGDDDLTSDGFSFTIEPLVEQLLQGACGETSEELVCSFFDEDTGLWSQEGCDTFTLEDGTIECVCYHTTSFALLIAETNEVACDDGYSAQLIAAFWSFMVLYLLVGILASVQVARILKAKIKISMGAMYQVEHAIVAVVCLLRVIYLALKGAEVETAVGFTAIFTAVPLMFLFVGFTFVVVSWAAIYHFSMKQPRSFFEPLKIPFIAANIFVGLTVCVTVFCVIYVTPFETAVTIAQFGESFLALVNLMSAAGFAVYGTKMYNTLKQGSMTNKNSKSWFRRTENRIFLATTTFCVCFAVQAGIALYSAISGVELELVPTVLFFTFELLSILCMLYLFQQGIESAITRADKANSVHSSKFSSRTTGGNTRVKSNLGGGNKSRTGTSSTASFRKKKNLTSSSSTASATSTEMKSFPPTEEKTSYLADKQLETTLDNQQNDDILPPAPMQAAPLPPPLPSASDGPMVRERLGGDGVISTGDIGVELRPRVPDNSGATYSEF